jgi:hypothetical protein
MEYWNRKSVVDYLLYVGRIICVKFWERSKADTGYQPRVANDCGPSSIQMKNYSHFSFNLQSNVVTSISSSLLVQN